MGERDRDREGLRVERVWEDKLVLYRLRRGLPSEDTEEPSGEMLRRRFEGPAMACLREASNFRLRAASRSIAIFGSELGSGGGGERGGGGGGGGARGGRARGGEGECRRDEERRREGERRGEVERREEVEQRGEEERREGDRRKE